jgi:orotate phosphoribosyltransferase
MNLSGEQHLSDDKLEFIRFLLDSEALVFGDFTLKSGRKSCYFFNVGVFKTGPKLLKLGRFYSRRFTDHFHGRSDAVDLLFGPAYKGIPLVTSMAIALAEDGFDYPYAFNRKEVKNHGEGGQIVGEDLTGKNIVLVDDVITAGTALRESKDLVSQYEEAKITAVLIALDRQECVDGSHTAVECLEWEMAVPVISIVTATDLICYLESSDDPDDRERACLLRRQIMKK